MENKNIKALYIIVNAGFSEDVVDITRECGATGATLLNARGTAPHDKTFLGIHIEPEKEMIITIVEESVADKIMQTVTERMGISTPAHAVCFSLPVEKTTLLKKQAPASEENKSI